MEMKYARGLLMAIGNFSALPCPYHKWHDNSRKTMLSMLPAVGLILAGIIIAAWWLLDMTELSPFFRGVILTILYFCCCGFIHLDGFMDCCDAILSRRPELRERQRILKSPDVGAFAVISMVLMILVFVASMAELADSFTFREAGILLLIMFISRAIAADHVMRKPTMATSQYADMNGESVGGMHDGMKKDNPRTAENNVLSFMTCLTVMMVISICRYCCSADMMNGGTAESLILFYVFYAGTVCVQMAAICLTSLHARKQLGGMNGDIAGYMIVISETAAVFTAAVMSSFTSL